MTDGRGSARCVTTACATAWNRRVRRRVRRAVAAAVRRRRSRLEDARRGVAPQGCGDRRLGRRLILTDLLGTGSSDAVPIHDRPAMQAWTDGLVAVLDAVGSECVSVLAMLESALPVMLLAGSGQIVSRFAPALGRAPGRLRGFLFRLGRWAVRRTPSSPDRGASCCQVQPLSD